ncbi:MAG: 2Fe-2S iron-sulfur cluster-binding protein [Myxococcaceae bacterium]
MSPKDDKPSAPPPPQGRPSAKHAGLVTVTVDGQEVVAKPGTNLITAAKTVGADIPYYCWHHRLSIAANCRMCLVESSTSPKLVPACQTALQEGMSIRTDTARVKESQRSVMEFLLLNHPVDCAICDQAGECKLEDYYQRLDHKPSRLEGGKILRSKRKVLGPLVVLDQERCVQCTRCVRFMDEVAKEPQLGMFARGSAEYIDVFPGQQLTSNYSGNVVDLCPVGALLNRDFRFRARSWFLSTVASVCTGCSRGCNIYVDFMGQDSYRYRPRENDAINQSWMCDQGRLSYKPLNTDRVKSPSLGRLQDRREVTAAEALASCTLQLKTMAGTAELAVLVSPLCSNEDLLAGLTFAKDALGVRQLYVGGRPEGAQDAFLMRSDKNPNRKGLQWISAALGLSLLPFEALLKTVGTGTVKALYVLGAEVPHSETDAARIVAKVEFIAVQAANASALTDAADVLLPAASHVEDEGSFVQEEGVVQRFRRAYPPRGAAQGHWKWAVDIMREFGFPLTYASAQDVFRELSGKVSELQGFEWEKEAPPLKTSRGIQPLPSGADGRPPGYREFGAPRIRGI